MPEQSRTFPGVSPALTRRQWLTGAAALAAGALPTLPSLARAASAQCSPVLDHSLRPLMGAEPVNLCERYGGDVLLIVNTASRCGFTPQFESLETLYQRYRDRGLHVLGFPSDDFRQELATEEEVAQFCELNYGVTFPMFQKVNVLQQQAHPLYASLADATGKWPAWNFNKYLVDRNGQVVSHHGSTTAPLGNTLVDAIEQLI